MQKLSMSPFLKHVMRVLSSRKQPAVQIILIIIAVVAYVCLWYPREVSSQKKRSDRELAGLVGPVILVREYRTFSRYKLKPKALAKLLQTRPYRTSTYDMGGDLKREDNLWGRLYTYSYSTDGF